MDAQVSVGSQHARAAWARLSPQPPQRKQQQHLLPRPAGTVPRGPAEGAATFAQEKARSCRSRLSMLGVGMACCSMSSVAARQHRLPLGARPRCCSKFLRRKAVEDADELASQAAKIRAEAAALEKEVAERRRKTRAAEILQASAGGSSSSSLAASSLREGLKEVQGLEITDQEASELVAAAAGSAAASKLSREQLASADFDVALSKLMDKKAAEKAAKAAERLLPEKPAEQAEGGGQQLPGLPDLGMMGGDDGLPARLGAILAYVLPLVDAAPYGFLLGQFVPEIFGLLNFLSPLYTLKEAIPFGELFALIVFTSLARGSELPQLVRFNLAQAVVLDVLILLPAFISSFLGIQLPSQLLLAADVILLGCVAYSVVLTLLGREPDGLGFISDATRRNLGQY